MNVLSYVSFGIFLVLGGGFFYLIGGTIDCSHAIPSKIVSCNQMRAYSIYGLPIAITGLVMCILVCFLADNNQPKMAKSK